MSTATVTTNISDGLNFILSHLDPLWSKLIAVKNRWKIGVASPRQAISEFYKANLQDCRINVYPHYTDDFYKRRHKAEEAVTIGGNGVVPSLLFIDLDKGSFANANNLGLDANFLLKQALFGILDNINIKFHGNFKPTILSTGNGYHIYQPVQLSGPSWCLGHIDIFRDLTRDPDREFLRWVEPYISGNQSDQAHNKTVSLLNCYLRIPGSINSKNGARVKVIQRWDGQRPYINWILRDFRRHLIQERIKPADQKRCERTFEFSTNW